MSKSAALAAFAKEKQPSSSTYLRMHVAWHWHGRARARLGACQPVALHQQVARNEKDHKGGRDGCCQHRDEAGRLRGRRRLLRGHSRCGRGRNRCRRYRCLLKAKNVAQNVQEKVPGAAAS